MEIETSYEIDRTVDYILTNSFTRVALQFPDELLKDSTKVVRALRDKIQAIGEHNVDGGSNAEERRDVGLYVMADTTYGSCCVDEVGAAHINADCVIHYGHTCLSPTSSLPAFFVFGKASISVAGCTEKICDFALSRGKPVLVLYGLEYAHAMHDINERLAAEVSHVTDSTFKLEIYCADVLCSTVDPSKGPMPSNGQVEVNGALCGGYEKVHSSCRIGGLSWSLPPGQRIEDYLLFWIGSDDAAFANVVLTFNCCEIVRYDAKENCLLTDVSEKTKILRRRYYLVEKSKDANIVGIVVGTLGVAGYLHMIHRMKQLVTKAGKKAYTLVVGRPNPAKLANFPECDVFVYVSCAQTALLDSKEFLAPIITPFEAMLAFTRGRQWTGEYTMEFRDLINLLSLSSESDTNVDEPRYSFFQGGYVEEHDFEENPNYGNEDLALAITTEKALRIRDGNPGSLARVTPKSGPEYLAMRSYQGLDLQYEGSTPKPVLIGRTGKASGYEDERSHKQN